MTLSAAIKEAYASCPSDVVELPTIEVYHTTWPTVIRLVRDRQNLTATLEVGAPNNSGEDVVFTAFPFNFTLPKIGEGRQELRITVDGASRIMIDMIESMDLTDDNPVRVIYRPYLSTDLSGPHMNPPLKLVCRSISINAKQVSLSCGYADFMNRKFPRKIYRIEEFPGLQSRV